MKFETFVTGGVISGSAYFLFGGTDKLFWCFCVFLVLDYITGMSASFYEGKVSSRKGLWGLGRKILLFSFIIIANQLDMVAGNTEGFLRDATLLIMVGNEGISVLENLSRLGLPIPKVLRNALEKVRKDEKDESKKDGEE